MSRLWSTNINNWLIKMNEIPSQDPADDDTLAGVLRSSFRKMLQGVDGMLPAVVVAYDRTANIATVQPLIQVLGMSGAGTSRAALAEIPVLAIGGGGFVVNFPLQPGDKGWIEASDRDISLFKQSGGEAKPNTVRLHSFSDARFIPDIFGDYTIAGEDDAAMVIQSLDGATKITLSPDKITLQAPEIMAMADSMITLQAPQVTLDTPMTTITGNVVIAQGLAIMGGGGASADITGAINITGQITCNGKDISDAHQHSGVYPGSGVSGGVV